jgi:DNA mismatch repair ATPase MutS
MSRSTKQWNERVKRRKSKNNNDEYITREYKKSMSRYTNNILDSFRSEFIDLMEKHPGLNAEKREEIEEILDESIKNCKVILTKNILKQKIK